MLSVWQLWAPVIDWVLLLEYVGPSTHITAVARPVATATAVWRDCVRQCSMEVVDGIGCLVVRGVRGWAFTG